MKSRATILAGLFVSLAIGCVVAWSEWSEVTHASETTLAHTTQIAQIDSEETPKDGAKEGVKGGVLPAGQFFGQAAVGYKAAQQCPEIIAKLFCYCGCDNTDAHTSLLDCFTSKHGADCPICTEEAVVALQMKKLGRTIPQIQFAIDSKFGKEYPFDEPSPALKKYRRLALGMKTSSADKPASTKLKSGHKASSCCNETDSRHRVEQK